MISILLLAISLWIETAPAAPVSRDDPEQADLNPTSVSTAAGSAVVVTAHPKASEAAQSMLKAGGHAVDALVAAQAVLAVVEPQSSGLGGGGFLLHWNAQQRSLEVLDGRETAPERSRPDDLLTPDGEPLPWRDATRRLSAIGIPGTVALLWEAHQQYGHLPWAQTLEPAIHLARDGFKPSQRFIRSIQLAQRLGSAHNPAFQALYLPGGEPASKEQRFRNPHLARTLQQLARDGGPAFYRGALAQQILREINALAKDEPDFQGWSATDLSSYTVIRRAPLCAPWLTHQLCTVPAPSSGGLAVLQTLALLTQPGHPLDPTRPSSWRRLADAIAWADADRLYWIGDPLGGAAPVNALLDPGYIRKRSLAMGASRGSQPGPGLPPGVQGYPFALPASGQEQGTSHLSIVDSLGNLASYTASVETVFGSRHLVAGMVMNNQLTDFSFRPSIAGQPVANQRQPGHRPASSMAPMIVFRNGDPVLALGSPGGRRIPHYLSRVLVASLLWGESPKRAVALPHLSRSGRTLVLERDSPLQWPVAPNGLASAHQPVLFQDFGSGIALLQRINGRWHGAADPRREGTAVALP
ncbi:gamma-glutamyltransferase family protein [Synechococcus sp. MIT S1220]|uniref:gamma-glutamyltransferase family protein n=1 Tax=Synechococcus sp. MIT S1220 TaxID=3082549 RepID=UPI0039B0A16C